MLGEKNPDFFNRANSAAAKYSTSQFISWLKERLPEIKQKIEEVKGMTSTKDENVLKSDKTR